MCPSFMVTHEEKHATRGRAHQLWEMLNGEVITKGWRDDNVKEALDLCLACKGCKGDCPVNVDMATYKAEFLSHYWEGRLRPRYAYAFGLIDRWSRLASVAPGLVNLFTQLPVLSSLAKKAAGIPQQRQIPAFAAETFKRWFSRRGLRNQGMPKVILWPDTFNNYFWIAPAVSRYSSQCAVGVTASRCALASTKMWLETGRLAASARPAARNQPVTPPPVRPFRGIPRDNDPRYPCRECLGKGARPGSR